MVTAFMALGALAIDIMIPAFPDMRHEFGMAADSTDVGWIITAFFLGVAVALVSALLGLSSLLRPNKPSPQKHIVYESGVDPVGSGWSQSQIRYYIFALLFVMFDVEAVFIFPWATQLERYAGFGLVEMGIFVFVLLLGLVYAWRKGVLRWV